MRSTWIPKTLLLVFLLTLCNSAPAHAQADKTPDQPACEDCVSRVFTLPDTTRPYESQDIANLFRTVLELKFIHQDPSQHTIAVQGTSEQVTIAEKLLSTLERLRTGGNTPTSVLVHELQQPISSPVSGGTHHLADPDLASASIAVLYRPNDSMQQLQALADALRVKLQILRLQHLPSAHVIVVRGTAAQIKEADRLTSQ